MGRRVYPIWNSEGGRRAAPSSTVHAGMRALDVLLKSLGVHLDGWQIAQAMAVSADGLTIAGTGYDPSGNVQAFIAVIPEPTSAVLIGLGLAWIGSRRCRPGANAPSTRSHSA